MVYLNDQVDALDTDLALARVSAQRREQALRFRHEGSRRLCLAAYLLLMDGLREEYGLTMNDREQEQINASADPAMRFLYFWTRKEAVLKLTGEGIRNDVKEVLAEEDKYQIETVQTEKYIFSVAKFNNIPEN